MTKRGNRGDFKTVNEMIDGFVGWPEAYGRKYQQAGYWQGIVVGDIIDGGRKDYPDRTAISFEGKQISYKELSKRVDRLALHLLDMGHKPMDRLILQLPNVPETLYLYFAAVKIGVIPVMTLPAHREAEIGYFAEFTQATSYALPREFRGYDYVKMAQEISSQVPTMKHVIVLDGDIPANSFAFAVVASTCSFEVEVGAESGDVAWTCGDVEQCEVEIEAARAMARYKIIPAAAFKTIEKKASFNIDRIDEIEKEVDHDVIAFLTSVAEHVGEASKYVHFGMT